MNSDFFVGMCVGCFLAGLLFAYLKPETYNDCFIRKLPSTQTKIVM